MLFYNQMRVLLADSRVLGTLQSKQMRKATLVMYAASVTASGAAISEAVAQHTKI